jgi:hypothetical protein
MDFTSRFALLNRRMDLAVTYVRSGKEFLSGLAATDAALRYAINNGASQAQGSVCASSKLVSHESTTEISSDHIVGERLRSANSDSYSLDPLVPPESDQNPSPLRIVGR